MAVRLNSDERRQASETFDKYVRSLYRGRILAAVKRPEPHAVCCHGEAAVSREEAPP